MSSNRGNYDRWIFLDLPWWKVKRKWVRSEEHFAICAQGRDKVLYAHTLKPEFHLQARLSKPPPAKGMLSGSFLGRTVILLEETLKTKTLQNFPWGYGVCLGFSNQRISITRNCKPPTHIHPSHVAGTGRFKSLYSKQQHKRSCSSIDHNLQGKAEEGDAGQPDELALGARAEARKRSRVWATQRGEPRCREGAGERAEGGPQSCCPAPWQAKHLREEGELPGGGICGRGLPLGQEDYEGQGMSESAGGQRRPCLPPVDKCKTLTLTSYFFHLKITHYQCNDDYSEPQFITPKAKLRMCIWRWQGSTLDHAQWSSVSYKRAFRGQRALRMVFEPGYWPREGCLDFEPTRCVMVVPVHFALGCP